MKAGGATINDVPKIHCEDHIVNDHTVSFEHSNLRIPLQLNGVFSYFHTRVPTEIELHECEKLFLTPDSSNWNPHCQFYEKNERSIINFEGDISKHYLRSNDGVIFENDKEDAISELATDVASVTTNDWEDNID